MDTVIQYLEFILSFILAFGMPALFLLLAKIYDIKCFRKAYRANKGSILGLTLTVSVLSGLFFLNAKDIRLLGVMASEKNMDGPWERYLYFLVPILLAWLILWICSVYELILMAKQNWSKAFVWLTVAVNNVLFVVYSVLYTVGKIHLWLATVEGHEGYLGILPESKNGPEEEILAIIKILLFAFVLTALFVFVKILISRFLSRKYLLPTVQPEGTPPSAPSDGEGADGANAASADLPPSALS